MKIYYIFDALCGWCWGFSPVINKIYDEYHAQIDFEVISGGLALGERAAPIRNRYKYIIDAIPQLEETTGITFGQPYQELLTEGSYLVDSMPPAKALGAIKKIAPEITFKASTLIQKSHFAHGKNLNDWNTYAEIIHKLSPNKTQEIEAAYHSPAALALANQDFIRAYQFGAQAYPTLILSANKKLYALSRGYTPYNNLATQLATALKLLKAS